MTADELRAACQKSETGSVMLVNSTAAAPFHGKGWPRGSLLCINPQGQGVWMYDAKRLLAALDKQLERLKNTGLPVVG